MLIFFRNKIDIERYHLKIYELMHSSIDSCKNSTYLSLYEVTFSESKDSTNSGDDSNPVFMKYDQCLHNGQPFYYMKIDDIFLTCGNIDKSIIISILLNMMISNTSNESEYTDTIDTNNEELVVSNLILNIYDQVQEVWNGSPSWGTCFDFISSCLFSSKYQCVCIQSNPYVNTDDYLLSFPHHFVLLNEVESDFSLTGGLWSISLSNMSAVSHATADVTVTPSVTTTAATTPQTAAGAGAGDDSSTNNHGDDEHEWEIVNSVTHDMSDLHIHSRQQPVVTTTTDADADINSAKEEDMIIIGDIDNNNSNNKFTYKDAILKKSEMKLPHVATASVFDRSQPRDCWKPMVVVVQTPYVRADRLYGKQPYDSHFGDEGTSLDRFYKYIFRLVGVVYNKLLFLFC